MTYYIIAAWFIWAV